MSKKFNTNGIGALLKNAQQLEKAVQDNPKEVMRELAQHFLMVPVDQIQRYSDQPRQDFDEAALRELADSIRVHGVIQPITVRRVDDGSYQLISGERRFRASKLANLTEIPAYVRLADDQQMMEMALIENIQREDLNPLEVAMTYERLKNEFNLTDEALSGRVGKDRATITNYRRLLELSDEIKLAVKNRDISFGHARALAGMGDRRSLQNWLLRHTVEEKLSVRAVESLVKAFDSRGSARFHNWLIDRIGLEQRSALSIVSLTNALSVCDPAFQQELIERILDKDLSVGQVETAISEYQRRGEGESAYTEAKKEKIQRPPMSAALRRIEDQFREFFGVRDNVSLRREDNGKGQIVIKFESDEQLNALLDRLMVTEEGV
jgi:ParB family transcriptional regulator, chromosome partitioning protein